jgi:two-component system chemotaxis response regulator CheY
MLANVLIVDDSATIRKMLARVLRQNEVIRGSIFEAGDGVQALEVLENHPVSLVLSDINMPNMDGLEFLKRMRAKGDWAKIPVVMITTEGSEETMLEAMQAGASAYVQKPFTANQIKEKLSSLL